MHTHTLPHTTPYTLHHTLTRYTIHSYHSRKKIAITTNHSVDGSHTCNVEGKKPESKDYILCGSNYMTCLENAKITGTDQWLLGVEWAGWGPQLGVEGAV